MVRTDKRLVIAVVPDNATDGADSGTQRGLGDDAAVPYRVNQFFPGNNSIAVANKVNEQIENLGFDRNPITLSPQFLARNIDFKIGKTERGAIPRL